MDILLIRHGLTAHSSAENYNAAAKRPDPPLNARGREQAALLAGRLADSGIQKIYTSDLARTMETTQILNGCLNVPVEVREELREIDMGRLHHCSWQQLAAEDPEYPALWHRHETDLPYPGGECGADAASRTMNVLREIAGSELEKAAVVCHGGIIRVALCAVLGIGQEKRFLFGPPENTSVSIIRYDGEMKEFSVFSVNDFSHLSNSLEEPQNDQ